jgi:hypothetical protein
MHTLCKLASFFINPQAMQSLIHESTIPSVHACVVDDDDDHHHHHHHTSSTSNRLKVNYGLSVHG